MPQTFIKILFIHILFITVCYAQTGNNKTTSLIIGDSYRIYPSNVTQSEVFIVNHPANPDIMWSSANTYNFSPFFISEGIYVTTNGGTSWRGSDTCKGQPISLHGGDPGIAIDKEGRFIITRLGFTPGLFSHYSTDNGLTWSFQKLISNDDLERATLTTDATTSSNFFGRTYAVWIKRAPPFPLVVAYTNNGGENWNPQLQVNNPIQRSAGGEIKMGLNGTVHTCWAGVTNVSPFTEDFIGFASSTDGGINWSVQENVFDMNGIAGLLTEKANIRVNGLPRIAVDTSGGTRNGWIYIVTTQKNLSPAGSDPDIILNRSSDNGNTWSSSIRVNQDPLNNGAIQYFPAVHVDKLGGLNVLFYDDRNTSSDSTGVFLARSEDGGNNWREFEISDHNFKPTPIAGTVQGYQGDNIDISSANGKLWPVWMDNSTGIYQIWTVPIEISSVKVDNQLNNLPNSFNLEQNFPNPFNPGTTIKFKIPVLSFVTIKVYDVLGNEVTTLVNEEKSPGNYEVSFNGENLISGIYFFKLSTNTFTKTLKMILIK